MMTGATLKPALAAAALAALLAACGDSSTPTASENSDLDAAAQLLDNADTGLADIDDGQLAEDARAADGDNAIDQR